jgi:outer membrane protein assembly factor BamB
MSSNSAPAFRFVLAICICFWAQISIVSSQSASEYDRYWPQWRGPLSTGEAPYGDPPVRWDEKTNIRWKIPLPGLGHATPAIWGDRIFVLTAVPAGGRTSARRSAEDNFWGRAGIDGPHQYEIIAINRKDGSIIWRKTARTEAPHDSRHEDASLANCSPVTDGKHVIAFFGSRGIFCYDMEGNLQWGKDFGDMRIRFSWGEGASPALSGDRLIVPWDHDGNAFLFVLDKSTGKEIWRANRDDGTSWSTPLVVEHNGRKQAIVTAIRRSCSYDLETGKLLWETSGMTANPIPAPVSADGMVYLMGGYSGSILQAISLEKARGSAYSSRAIVWDYNQDTPYVPSPLLYGGNLYFLRSNTNILSCFDARTGKPYYSRQRVEGIRGVYASPVAANGRVYLAGRNGVTAVFRHGPKFELLAQNELADSFSASPVIVGKELYLRGYKYLYCIASQ